MSGGSTALDRHDQTNTAVCAEDVSSRSADMARPPPPDIPAAGGPICRSESIATVDRFVVKEEHRW